MKTKLTRLGNDVALVLDAPLLEEVGLDEGAEVEVEVSGRGLVVTPVGDSARQQKLREAVDEMDAKYADVFRRLAK